MFQELQRDSECAGAETLEVTLIVMLVPMLQELQRDIESHSRIVSAVLKLCNHVKDTQPGREEVEALHVLALNLERRWHSVWLQSLEWQCRLEEAIKTGKVRRNVESGL